jgi:hypothetical protein
MAKSTRVVIDRPRPPGPRDAKNVLGWFNVKAYGAVGDGTTDDTAAIQAAVDAAVAAGGGTVWFPKPSVYYRATTGNIVIGGNRIKFEGDRGARVVCDGVGADLFVLGTASVARSELIFRHLYLTTTPSAGHIFNVPKGISHVTIDHCTLEIQGTAKSVLYMHSAGDMINVQLLYNNVLTMAASTVPAWIDVVCSSGGANGNTVQGGRHTAIGATPALGAGVPPIHVESSSASTYTYDWVFRDILFEVPSNGCIRLMTAKGHRIENCTVYDLHVAGGSKQHGVIIGAGAGGLASQDNVIRNYKQRSSISGGSPLGTGMKDISLVVGKAVRTVMDGCWGIIDGTFTVDNNFNAGTVFLNMRGAVFEDVPAPTTGQLHSSLFMNGGFLTTDGARVQWGTGPMLLAGTGSPEGVHAAPVGSVFLRGDGATGTVLYRKASGTGNTGWNPDALLGSATWDPASVADGAIASTTVTVTGAVAGDVALASHPGITVAGAILHAQVTAADTVTVTLLNKTGGALDLASGTLRVRVMKAA